MFLKKTVFFTFSIFAEDNSRLAVNANFRLKRCYKTAGIAAEIAAFGPLTAAGLELVAAPGRTVAVKAETYLFVFSKLIDYLL